MGSEFCPQGKGMLRNVNVRGPYVVTFLNLASMCEWHVTAVADVTRHQHETCYSEIGLRDQMIDIISRFNSEHNKNILFKEKNLHDYSKKRSINLCISTLIQPLE